MDGFALPPKLVAGAEEQGWTDWLAQLPAIVSGLAERWSLEVGPVYRPGGVSAWVAPARTAGGADLVLKVCRRHDEAEHEADGLLLWDGDGAVRLHRSDTFDDTIAMLLERCLPGDALSGRPEPEQDEVIAALLRRLWREPAAGHPFRPLQEMCDAWADESEEKFSVDPGGLDAGLARDGIALFRSLSATADRHVLLCTDLHAGNVLAAEREPWLIIDPKPYVGDPAYDVGQHLLNCTGRLHANPHELAWRMADLAGLDRDRVLDWLFARCVQEAPGWPGLADVARRLAPG